MTIKKISKKSIILILVVINLVFSMGMSYAYWASSITGDFFSHNESVLVSDWYDGIPIYTVDEFIQVITTDGNTNSYVLAKDLDFNNMTPASWTQTKDTRFMGSFDGLGHSISNINLTDYRGVFGIIDGAIVKNLTLDSVNINYTTSDSYTSGILSGRLQGTGNVIENIRIINSSVTNTNVFSGGLFGYASPLSGTGTATISQIEIKGSTISSGYSDNAYGTGGLIGSITNFDITMNDIYVEADIISNSLTSSGGLIGSTLGGSTVTVNRAVVNSSIQVLSTTDDADVGSGGLVGRNQGSITVTDFLFTGFLRAYVINPDKTKYTVQVGVIAASGNAVTYTNVISSEIRLYRRSANPNVLVNSETRYNKMLGQNPGYSTSVYLVDTTSLTSTWWSSNYSNITNLTSIWEYNTTTNLYELIN